MLNSSVERPAALISWSLISTHIYIFFVLHVFVRLVVTKLLFFVAVARTTPNVQNHIALVLRTTLPAVRYICFLFNTSKVLFWRHRTIGSKMISKVVPKSHCHLSEPPKRSLFNHLNYFFKKRLKVGTVLLKEDGAWRRR
jgi:hypothetical protein